MNNLLARLRDLVWPAVVSAGCSILAVLVALVSPEKGSLVLALGLVAVSMAVLSQRA
jgi:hypothetical protein